MKIAAVVILYYPEKNVINNILSYSPFFEKVYALDNSEPLSKEFENGIKDIQNCYYFNSGENEGIAVRLNEACRLAIDDGYTWLLTMDQDSSFSREDIENYLKCIENFELKKEVAMFGIEFQYTLVQSDICATQSVNQLITSGSIVNLELYTTIGKFDEALFIDQVDFDYCYRSILKGFIIIKFKNIHLRHFIGKTSNHISLRTFKRNNRSLHAPIRLYYMTRNFLYVRAKYKDSFKTEVIQSKKDLFNRFKNNILYNNNRSKIIRYILMGIADYKKKQMGKLKRNFQ